MNERTIQKNRENQAVIDLNICIGHYTCQFNKHTLQTPFFFSYFSTFFNHIVLNSFFSFSHHFFFFLFLFFFSFFGFSQLLKNHAIRYFFSNSRQTSYSTRFLRLFYMQLSKRMKEMKEITKLASM